MPVSRQRAGAPPVTLPYRAWFKGALLRGLGAVARRHVVLLPRQAGDDLHLLDVRGVYRVQDRHLVVEIGAAGPGTLHAVLLGYRGHLPSEVLWAGPPRNYAGPRALSLDLADRLVTLDGHEWGRVPVPLATRRFCWRLELVSVDGHRRERMTGHYMPANLEDVDESYYSGGNYVDHEAQSAGDHAQILALLKRHGARLPVLEIGCATGGLLAVLEAAGLPGLGLDASRWAIERARERLGEGHAWVCDLERDPLPAAIKDRGPFGALVLASVLEHFADPFGVLAALSAVTVPGTILVVTTTNADSLAHRLFGAEWEGYFDGTHLGVDLVSVKSLRETLPRLGWRIATLETHGVWDGSADPTRATLREWWAADARFRRLLAERDLGDLLTCVAVKE